MYIQTMIQRVKDKTQNAVHTYSRKIPLTNIKKYLCYMCVCTFHVIANFYSRYIQADIHHIQL